MSTQAQATLTVNSSNGDVTQFQYPCDQAGIGIANAVIHYANGTLLTSSVVTSTGPSASGRRQIDGGRQLVV